MEVSTHYMSPLGNILLAADNTGLIGAWFEGQKYFPTYRLQDCAEQETTHLCEARVWLDIYFSGREPPFLPSLCPRGTAFQSEVWALLRDIPYGTTVTYGDLARRLAEQHGIRQMSARAVGCAVGRNPLSILIPCHRVLGAGGQLTGYAGGIDRKQALLRLEGVDVSSRLCR